jgi:ribose/xylose/arabinose/galactoside ABC-type transport system permease subunit
MRVSTTDHESNARTIPNGHALMDFGKRVLREQTLIIVFIIIIVVMAISTPYFLKPRNLLNILLQSSMIGVSAAGMTMVILMADIDLSVGAVAAFAGVLAAKLQVESSWPTLPAILIPIAICFAVGIIVGVIVAKLGVHSFIATMGVLSIARGISFVITNGRPISGLRKSFDFIGQGTIGGVPVPAVIMLAILLLTWFVLTQTKWGRAVYSIGGNKEATRLSGISVDRIRILVFGTCAGLAGLAGIILAGRVDSGQPVAFDGAELQVIASVIIGGTSLYGGRGGAGKTLLGTLILGTLGNGLNLIGVTPYWQKVVIGLLIIVTVVADRIQHRKEA